MTIKGIGEPAFEERRNLVDDSSITARSLRTGGGPQIVKLRMEASAPAGSWAPASPIWPTVVTGDAIGAHIRLWGTPRRASGANALGHSATAICTAGPRDVTSAERYCACSGRTEMQEES